MRYFWPIAVATSCALSPLTAQEDQGGPTVDAAVKRGVELLIEFQEKYVRDSGVGRLPDDQLEAWQDKQRKRLAKVRKSKKPAQEWPYEGVYRTGGIIPPGYRVGGTAIVCNALVMAPGYDEDDTRKSAVARASDFMLEELTENERLEAGPKSGYDVRGWAHTYALDFFLLALRRGAVEKKLQKEMREMIPHLIDCIATNEVKAGGGWNYAGNSTSPFMTGSTLLALYQARSQGFEVDKDMVDRALDGLENARTKEGAYVYSGKNGGRRRNRTKMPGACARAAIAELCLLRGGRSDAKKLRVAVDAFFEHWGELLKRKSQQGTHVGEYGIAPYYFFYGHTYAALAIEALPEEDRESLRDQMQHTLWKTREEDGGWNDRIFPRSKSYSTAMALLALMAPRMDPVPEWGE